MRVRDRLERIAGLAEKAEAKLDELRGWEMESHYAYMVLDEADDLVMEIRKVATP